MQRMSEIANTMSGFVTTAARHMGVDARTRRRVARRWTATPTFSWGAILGTGMLGALVGGGLAMLFAPHSGPEARQRLRETASDMWDRTVDGTTDLRARTSGALARGRDAVAQRRIMWSTAFQAGREALQRERTRLGAA